MADPLKSAKTGGMKHQSFRPLLGVLILPAIPLLILALPLRGISQTVAALLAGYLGLWLALMLIFRLNLAQTALRVVLASISIGFSVLLVEITTFLKLVDYRLVFGTVDGQPWKNPLNHLDPELLHIHQGPARHVGIQRTGDIAHYYEVEHTNQYPYDVSFDSDGFRNLEDIKTPDIAVVGDSFIEAATVKHDQILTSVLAELQERKVINLGQLWYGPQQEAVLVRRFAIPLKPKTLVWVFFGGNDLSDYIRYEQAIADWEATSARFHTFRQRSFSMNILRLAHILLGTPPAREPAPYCVLKEGENKGRKLYFNYQEYPLSEQKIDALDRVVQLMLQAKQQAEAIAARFVVAYLPTKYQVYQQLCDSEQTRGIADWSTGGLADRLGAKLKQLNIDFYDMTPILREHATQSELLYFSDDTHWTPAGNRIAATGLHQFLK